MRINFAHLRERSTNGNWIDFAVFDARSTSGAAMANGQLLHTLTLKAQAAGLKVDQSALAYLENGRIQFYGSSTLVDYLARMGVPQWTHSLDV